MGIVVDDETTMPIILLDEELNHCIKPWQNFVNACNPSGDAVQNIYKILRQDYNATYRRSHVSFASPHDLMMFLMTWS